MYRARALGGFLRVFEKTNTPVQATTQSGEIIIGRLKYDYLLPHKYVFVVRSDGTTRTYEIENPRENIRVILGEVEQESSMPR